VGLFLPFHSHHYAKAILGCCLLTPGISFAFSAISQGFDLLTLGGFILLTCLLPLLYEKQMRFLLFKICLFLEVFTLFLSILQVKTCFNSIIWDSTVGSGA